MKWNICNSEGAVRYLKKKNRMSRKELGEYLTETVRLASGFDIKIGIEETIAYAYMNEFYELIVVSPDAVFIRDMKNKNEYVENEQGEIDRFTLDEAITFLTEKVVHLDE